MINLEAKGEEGESIMVVISAHRHSAYEIVMMQVECWLGIVAEESGVTMKLFGQY
jgi:hypothetical protein